MHKFITICAALFVGVTAVSAQNQPFDPTGKFSISVQGGPMYSRNENSFAYEYFDHKKDLFTWQASVGVGYDFNRTFGLRGNVGYAVNPGAGNMMETGRQFYPYTFKSISCFVDAILHLNGLNDVRSAFDPKLYAGIGLGNTSGFEKTPDNPAPGNQFHPWQKVSEKNTAFGFRGGLILEFMVSQSFGILADFGGEFYTDGYNGLNPGKEVSESGDKNFPLDFRGVASLGVAIHF